MAAILVASCNRASRDSLTADIRINEYITGYTSGIITRNQDIIIKFANPVTGEDRVGSVADSRLLSFTPSVKGELQWSDASTLLFSPQDGFEWDTDYRVTLNLKAIIGEKVTVNEFNFKVSTVAKNFSIEVAGLSMADSGDHQYELKGVVNTSGAFDRGEAESVLYARQGKTALSIEWEHDQSMMKHSFTVKGITRVEEIGEVELAWDGKPAGVNNRGTKKVTIPSLKEFKITGWRVVNTPSQYLVVEFSDKLDEKAELNGLVMIDGKSVSKVTRSGNTLNIFTPSRITGKHEIVVDGTVSNIFGYSLGEEITLAADFGGVKPGVRLTGSGVIVPQSEGLIFPFEAANLKSVDLRITKIFTNNIFYFLQDNNLDGSYELNYFGRVIKRVRIDLTPTGRVIDYGSWNAFSVDLANYITVEPGSIYRVEIGFRRSYSLFPCEENVNSDKYYLPVEEEETIPYSSYEQVYYNRYYDWQERDNPCAQAYYSPDRFVERNILGSNFGIIAKRDAAGQMNVIITNLKTAAPESDVTVEAFDFQNQKLVSVQTDRDGFATFRGDRDAFLIVARKNNNTGYLKTNDGGSLSMSNFDVSGQSAGNGTKGFIYGERGVWRPGDSVYVAFILEDKQNWLPDGHPIIFELYDSRGQMVKRMTTVKSARVIYPFWFRTADTDPTGNWSARVRVGGAEFNRRIRIETVKPNRLKINLEFDEEMLVGDKTYRASLNSKWLHGTPASGLKAKVGVTFAEKATSFGGYNDYVFTAPFGEPWFPEMDLFESKLDGEGNATVNFSFEPNEDVNSMLTATFITRVFEPGGDFSINRITKTISPFTRYAGFKIPWSDARLQRLNTDETHEFPVVTVDENGSPVSASNISVKLFKLEWRYWWSRSGENLANYSGRTYHKPVFTTTINTTGGKGSFKVSVPKGNWGRYFVLVTLPGGNVAGGVVYFDWPWGRQESAGGADMLNVTTDREKYIAGEEVTVNFPAGISSAALVSIENGSTVLRQEWVRSISENTTWKFTATGDMAPNVYIHVCLINPHAETANDLPIRMYGIAPVLIENPGSHLQPVIGMPDKLKPETPFTVKVSEKSGLPMEYTLAIVDDGLLDLTGFRTPDPWSLFYQKEALGVKTWDMYRYVLGAYGGKLEQMFAIGGDEAAVDPTKNKGKRFEPVVKVVGPFRLEKGKTREHNITLPQYVGSVRTMVVAAAGSAYGQAERTVPVNNPVMVLGTLPRVLGPGEKIKLPVSVFVMDENIKRVNVEVETSDLLVPVGSATRVLEVNEPGEYDIEFEYQVASGTGQAMVDITASSGNENGKHQIFIDVRNPNPPETKGELKKIEPGESYSVTMNAFGTTGTNSGKVEVSGIFPLNLEKRLGYLIRYPHGCIEQTTSAVFPQLYLSKISKMDQDEKDYINSNINTAIAKLRTFQMANGSMSFWPGGRNESVWGTIYATHFLLQAEKAGYAVPSGMKNRMLGWLRSYSNSYRYSAVRRYDQVSQAYALFVLALSGEPEQGAMNRMRERKGEMEFLSKWYLAGAYSLSGRKEVAYELADMRNWEPAESYYQVYGSIDRDKAVILNVMALMGEQENGFALAKELSTALSSGRWMSTQTTAWCLLGLSEFFGDYSPDKPIEYTLSIDGKRDKYSSTSFISNHTVDNDKQGGAVVELVNNGSIPIFAYASWSGAPAEVTTTDDSRGLDMRVTYRDRSGKSIDQGSVTQGTDFVAEVTITSRSAVTINDMALTQVFPAGWEIINTRLFEGAATEINSGYEYRDIRDDRVYTYFNLLPGKTVKFQVNLTAAYEGDYTLPAVVCEGMYDNSFYALAGGMTVKVVKE